MKYRLVPEEELLDLLRDSHRLACLDWDGVDNWHGYMEGRREYIAACLKETKQYKDKTDIELDDIIIDEDIGFHDLAEIDIEAYGVMAFDIGLEQKNRGLRAKGGFIEDWSGLPESLSEPDSSDSWSGFLETGSIKVDPDPDGWGGLQGGL